MATIQANTNKTVLIKRTGETGVIKETEMKKNQNNVLIVVYKVEIEGQIYVCRPDEIEIVATT